MSFKLKLTVRGAEPPVRRTVAVPSGTSLYDTSQIIVTAMGWAGGRQHKFTVDDDPATREIEDRVSVDDIAGERTVFLYDPARIWTVDCVFDGETDGDTPEVLDAEGDCPPQLMDGVGDYNRVMKASEDAGDPYRAQALAWRSKIKPYDMAAVNAMLASGKRAAPAFDFNTKTPDAVVLLMDNMVEAKDVTLVRKMSFRCPGCGSVCDGRLDPDCPPSQVRGTNRRPVAVVCPACGRESLLYMRNDGYHTGYSAHDDSRCMESLGDLYDLIRDFPKDGTDRERAEAECGIALAHWRHRSRVDNLERLCRAYDSLDPSDTGLRCRCLTGMFALDGNVPRNLDPRYLDEARELREGFSGAASAVTMAALARRFDDHGWYISRAEDLVSGDTDSPLADRIAARYALIDLANTFGDGDAVGRAAEWLEPITEEINGLENATTSEWSAYCLFFEFLVTYLRWYGKDGLAERAVKTASGPLVDDWTERIPASVRNVVGFRRALLFLTSDGDREQALDDLRSVRDSLATNEDNGPVTCIRVLASLVLMHWMDPSEEECLVPFAQMYTGVKDGRGWLPKEHADLMFTHFVNAFVGRGMGPGRLQGEVKKAGLMVKIGKAEPFDPESFWKYPMPEFT